MIWEESVDPRDRVPDPGCAPQDDGEGGLPAGRGAVGDPSKGEEHHDPIHSVRRHYIERELFIREASAKTLPSREAFESAWRVCNQGMAGGLACRASRAPTPPSPGPTTTGRRRPSPRGAECPGAGSDHDHHDPGEDQSDTGEMEMSFILQRSPRYRTRTRMDLDDVRGPLTFYHSLDSRGGIIPMIAQ